MGVSALNPHIVPTSTVHYFSEVVRKEESKESHWKLIEVSKILL